MKRLFILAFAAIAATANMKAQDEVEATIATDVVSQYIWRGIEAGQISVQPTLGLSYKGLALTAWGNIGLSKPDDVKEFDLTLSYTTGGFSAGVTDYWFSTNPKYFKYDSHETSHVFEAYLGYDFGPASLTWYTNFAGNDGVNKEGKRAYSSYVEANAPFKLAGLDWKATVGVVPYATTTYETTGFAVTNVSLKASKDIKITDTFSVPVFASINTNPRSEKAAFVFGFTLQP